MIGLVETVYLLRSPANARRLMDAMEESVTVKIEPQSIQELQQSWGLSEDFDRGDLDSPVTN